MSSANPYRLARTVVPSAYRMFLTPDLEAATFAGRVQIDVDINESISTLRLHALDLTLGVATITTGIDTFASGVGVRDEKYETVAFAFEKEVPAGPATVEITYTGVLNDLLVGFYRSTFTDAEGTTHTIATTQFEHSDARRAFPCFDEPSFKATYQVNLTVPSHLKAYSNSPEIASTDQGNGQRLVSFAPTMKMSTYLVAFVVGPFEETAPLDVNGTPLRIIFPPGKSNLTKLALDCGAFSLDFFSTYFDIPYPGDKLDMIAIPDFAFGAMENLGLVTYRETALLVDDQTASIAEQQRVGEVISHEIAHMWFGDLVTMEWWEGIWLNEAFATFCAALCNDAFRPEWNTWVGVGIFRDVALQIDGLHTTRPIEYEVVSPDDTRGMFDVLTYEKGGSVLRMLELYLGEEVYRDGIRHYLKKHSYANTVTTDLWDALEEISGQPVRALMNTWILQGGHPLVSLESGEISQQPFAYGPSHGESAIGTSWLTPVFTRSLSGGPSSRHLLGDTPLKVEEAPPVVVNAGGWGVFRSRYAPAELTAISNHLDDLDELERATLMADSWAALLAGHITFEAFLSLAKGLGDQNEPASWTSVATAIGFVNRVLDDDRRAAFADVVRDLFGPQFARLGWTAKDGEDALTPQLRSLVISTLGTVGHDETIRSHAVELFEANTMDGDLARSILRIVADQNRPGDYETYLERRLEALTPQEEMRYLWALCEFGDEDVARDAAEKCFSTFRTQDAPSVLGQLSMNRVTGPAVWRYFTGRWDEAMETFPPSTHVRLAMGVPTYINDEGFANVVEKFHREHPLGGEQRTIEQQLERMRVGLSFADAVRPQI